MLDQTAAAADSMHHTIHRAIESIETIIVGKPQQIRLAVCCLLSSGHCLIEDFKISAVKVGLIGSAELVGVVADLLSLLPDVPVILDPILAAGGGKSVSSDAFIRQLRE